MYTKRVQVKPIMAQEVCEGSWKDNSVLLVMPGGADLPYCKALNGVGNGHIRGALRMSVKGTITTLH